MLTYLLSQIEETRVSVSCQGGRSIVQQVLWTKDDLSTLDQVFSLLDLSLS